jgi:LPS-assembly protein
MTAILACFGLLAMSPVTTAQDATEARAVSCPKPATASELPPAPDRSGIPIVIYAQEMDASNVEQGQASGEVEVLRGDQHLTTDLILYNPTGRVVTIPGSMTYEDQQVWIHGSEAEYSFDDESGNFSRIDYGLTGSSANGSAEYAEIIGGHTSQLHDLDYTTCPGDNPDWILSARKLDLQHDEGRGVARGARLKFKGIPILYAPYFTFPIDDRRKTGFLYPDFGNTNDNGFEMGVPFYWNILPNHDATLTARYFTNRGFMLNGNYRFLTPKNNGNLDFDWMPDEKDTGDLRYHYRFVHNARPWKNWRTALIVDRVSDDRYFQDFGSNLIQTSKQFLRSSATMEGVGQYWNFELMADDFQVVDEGIRPQNQPYRRVPRLAFLLDRPLTTSGLAVALDSELVYFDRDFGLTGARLDIYPRFYWERYTQWGFIKPSVGYRYTTYNLDNLLETENRSPKRSLPIASLDAGLVFDRTTANGGIQTLEPRIFYLYVPYENQQDLPDFDTGEFTFGFSQLFNSNRFAGADRQTDANQLSVALTTRSFDAQSGQESWSLSAGQIFYFEPQRVFLRDPLLVSDKLSPFIAEFAWHPFHRVSAVAGLQYDWDLNWIDVGSFGIRWSGKKGQRIGFEYRFRRQRVDQFDFRIFWPINEQWRLLSRVNYSFADNDALEIQGGIEYESCCWAVRTVFRRYLKNRDGDYRDGIFLELNLKGLASLGNRAQELFP